MARPVIHAAQQASAKNANSPGTHLVISVKSPGLNDFSELWRLLLLSIFAVESVRNTFFLFTVRDTSPFYFRLTLLVEVAFAVAILSYLLFSYAHRTKKSKRDRIVHNISSRNAQFFTMIEDEVLESIKTTEP